MKFRCAGITDSMNDAPGKIALDVFFQGCSLGCKGCQNPELQDPNGGFDLDTDEIIDHLEQHKDFYQALVFLGGEPLEQIDALFNLASRSGLYNVLYTGWLHEEIPLDIRMVMNMIIDGPYIEELKTDGFPSSENQRIYLK
jgi:anaerobic ribonucleoside-triphosphate reductase activating protein